MEYPNQIIELYLTNKKPIGSNPLKKHLFKYGVKLNICERCGLDSWKDAPITMELHHVDGDNTNNQLTNLQILCPNCHSQCGIHSEARKNKSYKDIVTKEKVLAVAPDCESAGEILKKIGCRSKNPFYYNRVYEILCENPEIKLKTKPVKEIKPKRVLTTINWPEDEELSKMLWTEPREIVAQKIGCKTATLRVYCVKWKISKPTDFYWERRAKGETHEQALIPCSKRPRKQRTYKFSEDKIIWAKSQIELGMDHKNLSSRLKKLVGKPSLELDLAVPQTAGL